MSEEHKPRFRASATVSAAPMADGAVLIDSATGECFELNRTGARIWESLARGEELNRVVDALASDHSIPRATVSADAARLIDELVRRGILVATP